MQIYQLKRSRKGVIMIEQHIHHISDYCDHWCERCAFTSRCSAFTKDTDFPLVSDVGHPEFLERVRSNFKKAMAKIELNIDATRDVYSILALEKQKKKLLADNPLLAVSQEYAEMSLSWLGSQPGMLNRLEKLKEELTIGTESAEGGRSKAEAIRSSLAIIRWDLTLIHSKTAEALSLRLRETSEFMMPNEIHSEGVAKVVLLSIERSLEAWKALFDLLSDREDDFLKILAQMQKLERMVLTEFPTARTFKRPGFDDEGVTESSSKDHS